MENSPLLLDLGIPVHEPLVSARPRRYSRGCRAVQNRYGNLENDLGWDPRRGTDWRVGEVGVPADGGDVLRCRARYCGGLGAERRQIPEFGE